MQTPVEAMRIRKVLVLSDTNFSYLEIFKTRKRIVK